MGIDKNSADFMIYARAHGVDFSRAVTLGRQGLHMRAYELRLVLERLGDSSDRDALLRFIKESEGYADRLLTRLGAMEVSSIDNSDYEGATYVHDMNRPIPDTLKQRFTAVVDGGTLEHVFDFPTAMRNAMELLEVGGHFLGFTPANNYMGHGFYQFSPELFFRVFCEANGFELEAMLAVEQRPAARWKLVKDPDLIKRRVTLVNRTPTLLFVMARRTEVRPIFAATPQQSDFVSAWQDAKAHAAPSTRRLLKRSTWLSFLPVRIRRAIKSRISLKPRFDSGSYDDFDIDRSA